MEHDDRAPVATFFSERTPAQGQTIELGEDTAHHARVKRLSVDDIVSLTDGAGHRAQATIVSLRKNAMECRVDCVDVQPPPPALHVRAPIADRDRMLWLAEKAAEFGVSTWQGVRFRRSMSVSPRGEGGAFAAKLRTRMVSALEQSGGAWLPRVLPDVDVDSLSTPDGATSIVLDATGGPLLATLGSMVGREPIILFGPEGGIEPDEMARLESTGWRRARLASTTLRFETAGLAAIAVVRATQLLNEG